MPSEFAHYQFGCEMLESFPAPVAEAARARLDLYNIGQHGPDILFFYKALTRNAVKERGYAQHEKPASDFFAAAKNVYLHSENQAASLAYLLGFLCHFALDSVCHGSIENKIRVSGVSHTEIESEFERYLLCKAGKNPIREKLVRHICPTKENAAVIAPFFEGVTAEQVYKALRSVVTDCNLLRAPCVLKRALILAAFRISGHYDSLGHRMIPKKPNPVCADSCLRLEKLMNRAKTFCLEITENYLGYLRGENALSPAFSATFGPSEGWQDIPVLSLEEEKRFEV